MATKEHLEKRAGDRTRETKTTHTLRCSSEEASAYYTRKLLFSTSTAMKSRLVYYARVCIVCETLRYKFRYRIINLEYLVNFSTTIT